MIETLKKDLRGWNLGRVLSIADLVMNSENNRKELAKACGTYLLATRMVNVKEVREKVFPVTQAYPG